MKKREKMKTIFVLTAVKVFEGEETTLGFYSSEEKAKDALKAYTEQQPEQWAGFVLDITEQPVY